MSDYQIIDTNADNAGGCSHCGNKNANNLGHRRKTNWLREQYAEGLRYKVLRSEKFGDVGMIEYAIGEHAWRPVEAEGYLVIHCLWVYGKHKGKGLGSLLLQSCIEDVKKSQCRGVAVVTSSDSLMAGSGLFLKAGFVLVDRAISRSDVSTATYELLVMKLNQTAPDPRFIVESNQIFNRYSKGLTILAADQCPDVAISVERIVEASRMMGIEPKVVRVESAKASRELPTPYGVFSIIFDGKLIAHRPISATRFASIMRKNAGQNVELKSR
ncbi:MAG: GNAT family N-acetyltransferase [Lentisphaeria bacterium]|jgi:L-amino acid N-acyltransferase YncA|nr:GNAT family N-acetyltransferase [Lentisphaeria bacterium]